MTHRNSARSCWLWGAGITALLWGFLLCFSDIYFAANDDQFILRAMTGFQPGGTPDFHPFLLGFYVYPLRWLQRFFPGVAWYSLLELLLLALALTVILKSLLQCWLRAGRRLRTGLLLCAGYAALYGSNYLARVTFTVTGAMLGAAAVAQILSIDCQSASDRSLLRAMTLAILLLILCYGLRQLSLVPVLGYCGIAFLLRFCSFFGFGKQTKRSARPMLVAAGLALLILGGLFAGRALEIRLKQKQDALQWQQARSQVLDYINLKSLPSEALESVGWTDEQRILLDKWNTMDEAISTEALRSVRKNWYNSETTTTAGAAIEDLRWRSPWFVRTMVVLFGLGLFALFCAFRNRRENPWLPLALLMTGTSVLPVLLLSGAEGPSALPGRHRGPTACGGDGLLSVGRMSPAYGPEGLEGRAGHSAGGKHGRAAASPAGRCPAASLPMGLQRPRGYGRAGAGPPGSFADLLHRAGQRYAHVPRHVSGRTAKPDLLGRMEPRLGRIQRQAGCLRAGRRAFHRRRLAAVRRFASSA